EKRYWCNRIKSNLPSDYQMFIPEMPNSKNASYKARKIWFEKLFPYLNDEGTILIGHSLGTIFLLKYLTENTFPKTISQLHLVGTILDEQEMPEFEDYLGDFAFDITTIPSITKQVKQVFIYHSKDDDCCPYSHAERLSAFLPDATLLTFTDRGHFRQADFPELLEKIR
ncbi:MAG: alpha/beta hydrolase, partial [Candidatus Peribacteria bacterium]|nr:alpha/beta hydrolase [Candidatus Peribacteria bacterium]